MVEGFPDENISEKRIKKNVIVIMIMIIIITIIVRIVILPLIIITTIKIKRSIWVMSMGDKGSLQGSCEN